MLCGFVDILDIIGKSETSKSDSFPCGFIDKSGVFVCDDVGLREMRVGGIDCDKERLLCPDEWIDDLAKLFHLCSIFSNHPVGNILKHCEILDVHGSNNGPAVILQNVCSSIPVRVEIAVISAILQSNLKQVASEISLRICEIEQGNRVQRLMYISSKMDYIASKEGSLCAVPHYVGFQGFGCDFHDFDGIYSCFGVVDDWSHGISNIRAELQQKYPSL